MEPVVSVVIPTYRQVERLRRCVRSILSQTVEDLEVVVVDNGSRLGVHNVLNDVRDGRLTIVRLERNVFLCGALNSGISVSRGRYVATLNDDAWLEPTWAEHAVTTLDRHPEAGSVASLVVDDEDPTSINSAGNHLDIHGRATNLLWNQPVEAAPKQITPVFGPSSACAVYRRAALDRAGGFDERFVAYLEDIDLGFRLQLLGMVCLFDPRCRSGHVGRGSRTSRRRAGFLIERNSVWNVLKNFPTRLLQRHLARIWSTALRPLPMYDGVSVSGWLTGKSAALVRSPGMLEQRRRIQREATVSDRYIESLLRSRTVDSCHL
jgi:GT2 family glycosyltransferase